MKRILVVDDDKVILNSLKDVLNLEGYYVDTAETGIEALTKSENAFFNLALLDIKLPDMEGTELLQRMSSTIPKMVKIMLTGYPELDNAVDSLNKGADAYLMKPVDPSSLLTTIKEKLVGQEEEERIDQGRVKEWIETRVRKLKDGGS